MGTSRRAPGGCGRRLLTARPHRRPAQRRHRRSGGGDPAAADDESDRRARGRLRRRAGADLLDLARPSASAARRAGLVHALLDQRVGLALDLFLGLLARLFLGQPLPVLFVGLLARLVLGGASGWRPRPRAGARPRRRGWRRPGRAARASFSSSVSVRSTMPPAAASRRRRRRPDAAGAARAASWPAAPPPSFRVRAVGAAAGASALGLQAPGRRAAGVAAPAGRLTGFLTSTVTARVRPCENFWRTCVASPPLRRRARARRGREGQRLGRLGRLLSVPSYRLLSLVRSGPSTGAVRVDSHASAPPRPQSARMNCTGRIVARDRHIDRLLAAEDAAQRRRIAQALDRQAARLRACPSRRRRPRRPRPAARPGAGRSSARPSRSPPPPGRPGAPGRDRPAPAPAAAARPAPADRPPALTARARRPGEQPSWPPPARPPPARPAATCPRPGSRRARSGTTSPSGPTTKRIIRSGAALLAGHDAGAQRTGDGGRRGLGSGSWRGP